MEIYIANLVADENINNKDDVTVLGENVKGYIQSLDDKDIGLFGIVKGKLYYLGNDKLTLLAAKDVGILISPDELSQQEFLENLETQAVESVVANLTSEDIEFKDDKGNVSKGGIQLFNKTLENSSRWKIVTEVEDGELRETYGTGWIYIPKGSEVKNLGKLNCDYLVKIDTNQVIKFNPRIHTLMGYDKTMAVTDHLIFNADPRSNGRIQ